MSKKKLYLKAVAIITMALIVFYLIGLTSSSKKDSPYEQSDFIPAVESTPLPSKPNFANFKDVKEKKSAFFNYFRALISKANEGVLVERHLVQKFDMELETDIALTNKTLMHLCWKYKVDCDSTSTQNTIDQLLLHIDIIPPSLALAQAANESAWGTSRFALKANNYFGQWCFSQGCGLVPKKRNEGAKHEVRKFDSAYESVEAYIFNLNSNRAYESLRALRGVARRSDRSLDGAELAKGLLSYSERRGEYVKELQSMIRHNNLSQYDE